MLFHYTQCRSLSRLSRSILCSLCEIQMSGFALPATQPTTLLQDAELVRFGSFHLSEYDVFDYKQHLFEEN